MARENPNDFVKNGLLISRKNKSPSSTPIAHRSGVTENLNYYIEFNFIFKKDFGLNLKIAIEFQQARHRYTRSK